MARKTEEAERLLAQTHSCFMMARDDAARTGGGADKNPLIRMIQGHMQVTRSLFLMAGALRDIYDKLNEIERRMPRR